MIDCTRISCKSPTRWDPSCSPSRDFPAFKEALALDLDKFWQKYGPTEEIFAAAFTFQEQKQAADQQRFIHNMADALGKFKNLLLFCAAENNFPNQIPIILAETSVPIDFQDRHKNTALHVALKAQSIDAARSLLLHGASSRIKNRDEISARYLADLFNFEELLILMDQSRESASAVSNNTRLRTASYPP